jgi:hypothetical protein
MFRGMFHGSWLGVSGAGHSRLDLALAAGLKLD